MLQDVRAHGPELIRRREHDAGGDGYPTSAAGSGTSSAGASASSTESAALARKIPDPTGAAIDSIIAIELEIGYLAQKMAAALSFVRVTDTELRGRVSTVEGCDCCDTAITGVGDDRRRNGFCPACFASWSRWRRTAADPNARIVFIWWRRERSKESATTT